MLQLMISGSGAVGAGAAYDTLDEGLAIDESLVDIVEFESIISIGLPVTFVTS